MAVKQVHIPFSRHKDEPKEKRLRKLNLEIHTHREIAKSPYIVDFYGLCLHDGCALLFMELMDVSLHGLLTTCHNSGKNIPEDLLGYTAVAIVEALNVCKSKGIIHRDIKPENILIKKSGEIKLADFEVSRFVGESHKVTTIEAGTIRYWPPERLYTEKKKYDIRSDIWSFGLTLAEMAYGKHPIVHTDASDIDFQTVGLIILQNRILEAKADEIINRCVRPKYSGDLCEFIWLCLQKLEDRANVEELIETRLYMRFQAKNTKWVAKLILQALVSSRVFMIPFRKGRGRDASSHVQTQAALATVASTQFQAALFDAVSNCLFRCIFKLQSAKKFVSWQQPYFVA